MTDHLTPQQRKAISRIGGLVSAQRCDQRAKGRAGVQARLRRLYEQTDPHLPDPERHRLAELAWKEQLARARLSSPKRKARKAT